MVNRTSSCCGRSMLKLMDLQPGEPIWGTNWTKTLMSPYRVQISNFKMWSRWWCNWDRQTWNRSLVNRTASCVALRHVDADKFAISKTDTDIQMGENRNNSVYRLQNSNLKMWQRRSHVLIAVQNQCCMCSLCNCENRHGKSTAPNSEHVAIQNLHPAHAGTDDRATSKTNMGN